MVERRKRGDMITMFRIMTGKDKVDPSLWFSVPRSEAASTRQNTGWLNVKKPARRNLEVWRNQFSQRVVDDWNWLPDWVKKSVTVNPFKNNLDKHLFQRQWSPSMTVCQGLSDTRKKQNSPDIPSMYLCTLGIITN